LLLQNIEYLAPATIQLQEVSICQYLTVVYLSISFQPLASYRSLSVFCRYISCQSSSNMVPDDSIYSYNPSVPLAIVVACFYGIPTLVLAWQTFIKYRSWFFLCVLIGSVIEVGGYACRVVSAKSVTEIVSVRSIRFASSLTSEPSPLMPSRQHSSSSHQSSSLPGTTS
jgi:hypothetical protein